MKEITIKAEIIFLEAAKEAFIFPIHSSVRTSFWLAGANVSTFSQIQIDDIQVHVMESYILEVKLLLRDFLQGKITEGTQFCLGTFPHKIAQGKVLTIN